MSLEDNDITRAATALFEAEKSGKQIGLLSQHYPTMTMDDAYAVQAELTQMKIAAGRSIIGWKIGLTSKAMQYALNIDIPDSGMILDDMLFENETTIPAGHFIQPRIEAEIAFVMKTDLSGEHTTRADVVAATDYVAPSLELLDTRILRKDPNNGSVRTIVDTIADNAANAGIVLGSQTHAIDAFDLRWVGVIVSRNGEVEETGLGAGVMNDPVMGIVWLVQRLSQYNQGISAGQIVLAGSFVRPIEAPPDSTIEADFGPFGSVGCRFA